jgi:6-phosphofructokinase 1
LSVATEAVDRLHTTGESHKRVMVLEVMGRTAGWIALRAGIAGGGDVILIPEIPYAMERVCASIHARSKRGRNFSIVVVAEGAKPKGGERVVSRIDLNSPDPIRLGGIGNQVAQQIEAATGLESRATVLGHLQRGGTPTPYDRWLATRFGVHAVELVYKKKFGEMVSLCGTKIRSVPLKEAVNGLRLVDPNSDEVLTAKSVGTCFGD